MNIYSEATSEELIIAGIVAVVIVIAVWFIVRWWSGGR
jgi:hypothetical protein